MLDQYEKFPLRYPHQELQTRSIMTLCIKHL